VTVLESFGIVEACDACRRLSVAEEAKSQQALI